MQENIGIPKGLSSNPIVQHFAAEVARDFGACDCSDCDPCDYEAS